MVVLGGRAVSYQRGTPEAMGEAATSKGSDLPQEGVTPRVYLTKCIYQLV